MKDMKQIDIIIKKLLSFVGGTVEPLIKHLKTDIAAKIDDAQDVDKLEKAFRVMLDLEKRELHDEKKIQDAFELVIEQQRQISILKSLETAVKKVSDKPELFYEIENWVKQLEDSLETEVKQLT